MRDDTLTHGTLTAYRKGCRCGECRAANTTYQRQWREANVGKRKASVRKYYDANRDTIRERNRQFGAEHPERVKAYIQRKRLSRKAECLAYLGGACVRCGTTKNLEFDHIEPSTKEFEITTRITLSWDKLLPELDKTQLLCVSCHKAKTADDRKNVAA